MRIEQVDERAERAISVWIKINERLAEDLGRMEPGRVRMACVHEGARETVR